MYVEWRNRPQTWFWHSASLLAQVMLFSYDQDKPSLQRTCPRPIIFPKFEVSRFTTSLRTSKCNSYLSIPSKDLVLSLNWPIRHQHIAAFHIGSPSLLPPLPVLIGARSNKGYDQSLDTRSRIIYWYLLLDLAAGLRLLFYLLQAKAPGDLSILPPVHTAYTSWNYVFERLCRRVALMLSTSFLYVWHFYSLIMDILRLYDVWLHSCNDNEQENTSMSGFYSLVIDISNVRNWLLSSL